MRARRLVLRSVAVCAALAMMASGLIAAVPARADQQVATGWITSTATTGGCLDDYNGQTSPGSPVDLSPCLAGSAGETFTMMSDGTVQINGQCLTAAQVNAPDGPPGVAQTELFPCDGSGSQQWTATGSGALEANIVLYPSGPGCLDASNGILPGAAVPVVQCSGAGSQQWGVPVYGEYGQPWQVTLSGGDISVSLDDSFLDPNSAQRITTGNLGPSVAPQILAAHTQAMLHTLLPESLKLPDGASVNDMSQAAYSQAKAALQQQGQLPPDYPTPVSLPDETVSVNASGITLTVPKADIDQVSASGVKEEGAQIIATIAANIVGIVAGLVCLGAFWIGPLSPLLIWGSTICGITTQFANTIAYLTTYYLVVEPQAKLTPPLETILVTLFVNSFINGVAAYGIFPTIAKNYWGWIVRILNPGLVQELSAATTVLGSTTPKILAVAYGGIAAWLAGTSALLWAIGRKLNGLPYVVNGPGQITSMIPASPRKCLDVSQGSPASGAPAVSWDCDPGLPGQQVSFFSNGEVVSTYGMCLTEPGPTAGALLSWAPCTGAANQRFSFDTTDSGAGALTVKDSGLCLDLPKPTINNTQLEVETCTGSAEQQWILPPQVPSS